MAEVLILNPNASDSEKLETSLGGDNHCTLVNCKEEAKSLLENIQFDALIVDFQELEELKLYYTLKAPFFVTSYNHSSKDRVYAFNQGAADFIELPVPPEEFKARFTAKISGSKTPDTSNTYSVGPITADYERLTLKIHKKIISLTHIEFQIFVKLMKHPSQPISRSKMCESLNLPVQPSGSRKVDAHISNLRRKLGAYDRILGSVYGQGYVFRQNFL